MKKYIIFTLVAVFLISVSTELIAQNRNDADSFTNHPIKTVHIPELQKAAVIDGRLDEEVWKEAASFPSFVRTAGKRTGENAGDKTECFAFRNGQNLYIAFVCHDPEIENIKTGTTEWDDPAIIFDDRVEVFIDTDHNHRDYYELAVNPKGIQFDQKLFLRYPKTRTNENDPGWNCNWKARTSILADRWIAETEIDATSLGINRIEDGTTWGFNVARARQPEIPKNNNWRTISEKTEYSAWCLTQDGIWETLSNFQEPADFGDLIFGRPVIDIKNIRFKNACFVFGGNKISPSNVGMNPLEIQFEKSVTKDEGFVLCLKTTSQNGKTWEAKQEIETDISNSFHSGYFINENDESRLDIEIRRNNTETSVYRTAYILTVPPFIDFDLSSLYLREEKNYNPVAYRLLAGQHTLDHSFLEISLYNEAKKLIGKKIISGLKRTDDFQPVFNTDSLRALPGGNYYFQNILKDKNTQELISSFVQPFTKFDPNTPNQFKAVEGSYRYGGMEGDAVQVYFQNGQKYVFWKKASNVPWWDVGQVALTYEFVESNGFTTRGCTEAMQDRRCRYSKVEIIEDSPARKVIHWRYALTDARYHIHNNEWVDEYYRFYPDAVGVREINLWANSNEIHEFFEIIPVNPPAMQEKDMFDGYVGRLSNLMSGESYTTNDFNKKGKDFRENFLKSGKNFLIEVNLKNRMHPFAVFTCGDSINPGVSYQTITLCHPGEYGNGSHRGHWPASQYEIDGYNLVGNHRPSHGNIGSIKSEVNPAKNPNTFTVLLGIAPGGSGAGQDYGRSWLNPARIDPKTPSLHYRKYDIHQRAYLLETTEKTHSLRFGFSPGKNAVKNPVFILKGLPSGKIKAVLFNRKPLSEDEFQTGTSKNNETIVFINQTISEEQTIEFKL